MSRRDFFRSGIRHFQRGFTLLEMCIVLFIIALLLGALMPAMQSAFVEQAVRKDAGQLALMVRTAMLQSGEQHRVYVIDLTASTMELHPLTLAKAVDSISSNDDANSVIKNRAPEEVNASSPISPANKLMLPDPAKRKAWLPVASTTWLFRPGELCSLPRVRLVRGDAWIEMNFNALTGNVEGETAYFP